MGFLIFNSHGCTESRVHCIQLRSYSTYRIHPNDLYSATLGDVAYWCNGVYTYNGKHPKHMITFFPGTTFFVDFWRRRLHFNTINDYDYVFVIVVLLFFPSNIFSRQVFVCYYFLLVMFLRNRHRLSTFLYYFSFSLPQFSFLKRILSTLDGLPTPHILVFPLFRFLSTTTVSKVMPWGEKRTTCDLSTVDLYIRTSTDVRCVGEKRSGQISNHSQLWFFFFFVKPTEISVGSKTLKCHKFARQKSLMCHLMYKWLLKI